MMSAGLFADRLVARLRAFLLAVIAVGLAGLVTACSENPDEKRVAEGAGPAHIHGLGVNPRDGALFVAGHTGIYRLRRGDRRAALVSDSNRDTMGFTVVGPDRFLASGHSDGRAGLPSLRGLVESGDAGRTWTSLSLRGKADFHVLRARGSYLVGYDAKRGRVLASLDGGRHWRGHRFEGPLVDLVIDPANPGVLLATAQAQLLLSRDGGRIWRSVLETTGLLAWPKPKRLYLLAPDGRLWSSPDRGRRWKALGEIGGRPVAFAVADRQLFAARRDGVIKVSHDGGRSWQLLAATACREVAPCSSS
jgi:hypothetical protein